MLAILYEIYIKKCTVYRIMVHGIKGLNVCIAALLSCFHKTFFFYLLGIYKRFLFRQWEASLNFKSCFPEILKACHWLFSNRETWTFLFMLKWIREDTIVPEETDILSIQCVCNSILKSILRWIEQFWNSEIVLPNIKLNTENMRLLCHICLLYAIEIFDNTTIGS